MTLSVQVQHRFGAFALDVCFEAGPGVTVLSGRSGSGKTTLIKAVAGLLTPESGRIAQEDRLLLDTRSGVNLPPHRREMGVIFQEGRLFPHLTVRQNLSYARWFRRASGPPTSMARIVEMLGIGPLLDRRPALLSGGEKQRVAIGRALLAQPRLILADEPLAALDERRKAEILPYFERLREEIDLPILYVSHTPAEVARLATSVVTLEDGQILHQRTASEVCGDPADLGPPDTVIACRVVAHHADGLTELRAGQDRLMVPGLSGAAGQRVGIRVGAQDVLLALERPRGLSELNILPALIQDLRPGGGADMLVTLKISAGVVFARTPHRAAEALELRPGLSLFAVLKSPGLASDPAGATRTGPARRERAGV